MRHSTSSTALGASLNAIGGPIFLALIVAGMGHFLRLFALWAATREAASMSSLRTRPCGSS